MNRQIERKRDKKIEKRGECEKEIEIELDEIKDYRDDTHLLIVKHP